MAYYLKIFATQADYNNYISGTYPKPNISYIEATNEVMFTNYQPLSISFDANSYTMTGTEGDTITQAFTVTDDLGNDVTALCSYSFSPNDTGITASNGSFDASSVLTGTYSVTVTATFGNLTTTTTVSMNIAADYSTKYFTTEALENGETFTFTMPRNVSTYYMTSVSYSTDNGETWTTTNNTSSEVTVTTSTLNQGDKVLWKGVGKGIYASYNNAGCTIKSNNKNFNVEGNIMSLLYGDDFANQTTFVSGFTHNFANLFKTDALKLISAENLVLPAMTLTSSCYQNMFNGCTALTTAPALNATTLASSCYSGMFQGCTSLTTAPALNATTLAVGCYQNMFNGTNVLPDCTNIDFTSTTVVASGGLRGLFAGTKVTDNDLRSILPINTTSNKPYLPVTTLENGCYQNMFNGCTSLTTAPELPATTMVQSCYQNMFKDCSSLTTAPALNATTLAIYCYSGMFQGCTALTTPPELPATTMAFSCYSGMFKGCTALASVPQDMLPATTLAESCYSGMFKDCSSLTTAPALPATTLEQSCYNGMFNGCTSLTTAPALPATTLANYCYGESPYMGNNGGMFQGCTNLNSITMLATDISATGCLSNWVSNVASSGTFTKAAAMTTLPSGASGIPDNWAVVDAS